MMFKGIGRIEKNKMNNRKEEKNDNKKENI